MERGSSSVYGTARPKSVLECQFCDRLRVSTSLLPQCIDGIGASDQQRVRRHGCQGNAHRQCARRESARFALELACNECELVRVDEAGVGESHQRAFYRSAAEAVDNALHGAGSCSLR